MFSWLGLPGGGWTTCHRSWRQDLFTTCPLNSLSVCNNNTAARCVSSDAKWQQTNNLSNHIKFIRCAYQVWSLTQFYSVDFSQSRIDVKKCVFNKRTIKVCIPCISVVVEATHKTETRELLGGMEQNGVSLMRGHWFAWRANQWVFRQIKSMSFHKKGNRKKLS